MNAFKQAQNEMEAAAYRTKVERVKELIAQFEQAKKELADAQKKYDGIDKALDVYRKESPIV